MGELEGVERITEAIFDCVVRELLSSPGFDDFWWGIDQEYKLEICQRLRDRITKTLTDETDSYTATTGNPVQGWPV